MCKSEGCQIFLRQRISKSEGSNIFYSRGVYCGMEKGCVNPSGLKFLIYKSEGYPSEKTHYSHNPSGMDKGYVNLSKGL